jgi:hypothetical protein
MSRRVVLQVVDAEGVELGTFRCEVATPWLQEVGDVLATARAAGLALGVLRLVAHEPGEAGMPTRCSYLAEALEPPPAGSLDPPLGLVQDAHPLRLPYAKPGGNAADIAWADGVLRTQARRRLGAAEQQRTWNLSCVHRLPLDHDDSAWLKVVPPFFAHEGATIAAITRLEATMGTNARVLRLPHLLGHDALAGRVLLAHCEGPLMWGCTPADWTTVIDAHVDRQWRLRGSLSSLRALGLPDWRGRSLHASLATLCSRADVLATLLPAERAALATLLAGLADRLAAITACGLPDALVHGDLHPGNVIAAADGPVLLDWGDAGIGHPLLDVPALCHGFEPRQQREVRQRVATAWRARVPAADVDRALALMAPVVDLRQALVYRTFLDAIEPAERHYHEADVPARLRAALAAAEPA